MSLTPLPYQTPSPSGRDIEQIKLLVIFSYIWGALIALFSCFGFIYLGMGLMMVNGKGPFPTTGPNAMPPGFGWMFVTMGAMVVLIGWAIGALNIYSARSMQQRKRRMFSLIMAGVNCMSFPFGTALGVFTFVVLLRESAANLYTYGTTAPQ